MSRALLVVVVALGGCSQSVPVAPPLIHYGQDLCDVCSMIITDDRFAAAMVCEGPKGREARAFDDVGCLIHDETLNPDRVVEGRWVRDFRSDRWLVAGTAVYLQSEQLHSPMAFGLAACENRETAQRLAEEFPGELLDLDTARRRFDADTLILAPVRAP
jgi:nitrous oxide reductase accessory protein NosL